MRLGFPSPKYASLPGEWLTVSSAIVIRRPVPAEFSAIERLRTVVVNEIYRGLWSSVPVETGAEEWSRAWIDAEELEVVGVLLTTCEWLDDLWLLPTYRG